ncbi:MAG: hypothetical protein ACYDCI_00150 [Candidatus Limnocylindrales bacterium]
MSFTSPNIATSAETFAELQVGGLSATLERLITVNGGGTAAPTAAPTLAESGSGGTLPAATYYVVVTETNGIGETTASPVSLGQAITLGQDLVITPPALQSGNTARNYYVGTASAGPFTLAATGQTAATLTISAPLPSNSYAVNPPTFNSTAFSYVDSTGATISNVTQYIRAARAGHLNTLFRDAAWEIDNFLRGSPIPFNSMVNRLQKFQTAFTVLAQAFADIGGLVDANAGTIRPALSGGPGTVPTNLRTWP